MNNNFPALDLYCRLCYVVIALVVLTAQLQSAGAAKLITSRDEHNYEGTNNNKALTLQPLADCERHEGSAPLADEVSDARCYLRKMPGKDCTRSEECVDFRGTSYYCIQRHCSLPLDCPSGYAHVGPSCVPYAVTGGECAHPIQCLNGSLCMRGRCRSPCDDNQLFVGDECVDYEGAGCIARSCVDGVCPRTFPSCNWVPQKHNYLCCERTLRMSEQCPHVSSIPQVDPHTGEIAHCFDNNCATGYSCQFSKYRHGTYICCSNLPDDLASVMARTPLLPVFEKSAKRAGAHVIRPFQTLRKLDRKSGNTFETLTTTPIESVAPSTSVSLPSSIPTEILRQCCTDANCLRKHPRIQPMCSRVFPQPANFFMSLDSGPSR